MLSEEEIARQAKMKQLMQLYDQLPISYQLNLRGEAQYLKDAGKSKRIISEAVQCDTSGEELYQRISFRTENYIEQLEEKRIALEKYDIILCLSTIKWIQLNWGDVGAKALFLKVYQQLSEGGLFILEQ